MKEIPIMKVHEFDSCGQGKAIATIVRNPVSVGAYLCLGLKTRHKKTGNITSRGTANTVHTTWVWKYVCGFFGGCGFVRRYRWCGWSSEGWGESSELPLW